MNSSFQVFHSMSPNMTPSVSEDQLFKHSGYWKKGSNAHPIPIFIKKDNTLVSQVGKDFFHHQFHSLKQSKTHRVLHTIDPCGGHTFTIYPRELGSSMADDFRSLGWKSQLYDLIHIDRAPNILTRPRANTI